MTPARTAWIIAGIAVIVTVASLVFFYNTTQRLARGDDRLRALENRVKADPEVGPASEDAVDIVRSAAEIPLPIQRREPSLVQVELETVELDGFLHDGTTFTYWTFDGQVPGPLIRVRQGDTVELTLRNRSDSRLAHNIDLHGATGPGGGAAVTLAAPGEEKTFRFKALNPGLYIYHCAAPHIPTHIAMGMYGLLLVEPEAGLPPVDREFYIVQGEIYTNSAPGTEGHAEFAAERLLDENPHWVVFNGRYQSFTGDRSLEVAVGDRVRIFVGNAGPNLASSFHVIGEIFDVAHPEAASEAISNLQSTLIPPGSAAWVEFTVDVPGEYVMLDHAISRAIDKGALGIIVAEGPDNPEIFEALDNPKQEEQSGYD